MKELIERIFTEHGFSLQKGGNACFFEKKDSDKVEYYLVDFVEGSELTGYLHSKLGENIFKVFDDNIKKKKDVEKNTSLVLCIRLDDIANSIGAIKNDVLAFEEDDYWFKKYVIVYTNESIPAAYTGESQMEYFNTLLLNNQMFSVYKDDIYGNETYFLAIQLFLKLPFLIVPQHDQVNYRTITEILREQLSEQEFVFMEKLRTLEDIYVPGYLENLRSSSLELSQTDDIIQEFIKKFKIDA